MGYTSYWKAEQWNDQDKAGYVEAMPIVKKILKKYKDRIQKECDDDKKAVCNKKEIRFNGIDGEGHETFYFPSNGCGSFSFCKTARKSYDIVVCEILLVLNAYCQNLNVSSDGFGEDDENWNEAIENVRLYDVNYNVRAENIEEYLGKP